MNILTFDIEEWFHLLDLEETLPPSKWNSLEPRIERLVDQILKELDDRGIKATFLIVGWIAHKYPKIVKDISNAGHEIGSHTNMHQVIFKMDREKAFEDIKKSITVLEDLCGEKITTFRAPGFSIIESNKYIFETLVELGIENDLSVFPIKGSHGGFPQLPINQVFKIKMNDKSLKEFPMSCSLLFGKRMVVTGGGYFRLFPKALIKKLIAESSYTMTYFHPRDFDKEQPKIENLGLIRKFKTYHGIETSWDKFQFLLDHFYFINVNEASSKINWNEVKSITL